MPIRFQSIPFQDLDRARVNWTSIERTAPAVFLDPLLSLLQSSPDPDMALNYFERFNAGASDRIIQYLTRNPSALQVLVPLFSQSHFLSETLLHHPEYAEWLHRDKRIEYIKPKEDLLEELSRFESTLGDVPLAERLTRFKRQQYLRIALRDVSRISTLAETTWELSTLADVILEKALRVCDQQLRNRFGSPRFTDEAGKIVPAEFVIMALGKLGGNELNYSSDIDLLYLYSQDGETEGIESRTEPRLSNQEYFIKLSSAVTEAVSSVTPAGWAFRVDLRLRPQGREGFLARSLPSAIEYYQRHAEPWELQALLKARPVAGDLSIGKKLLQSVQSRVYPQQEKRQIIESINQMRSKLDVKLLSGESSGFNIKLERNTIRDIEFIAQCLQRVYGAEDPWLREANTVLALRRLHDNNYIARPEFVALASAYEFFRIIEHRLQLDRGHQTHTIPDSHSEQQRLAFCMGFENTHGTTAREALLYAIEYHRSNVNRVYQQLVEGGLERTLAQRGTQSEFAEKGIDPDGNATGSLRDAFDQILVQLPALASILGKVQVEGPGKISYQVFLGALAENPKLLQGVKPGPDWVEALEALFSSGSVMADAACRHPDWLIAILSSMDNSQPSSRHLQKRSPRSATSPARQKRPLPALYSKGMTVNAMRDEVRRRILGLLADDVVSRPAVFQTLEKLSAIAEESLAASYRLATEQLRRKMSKSAQQVLLDRRFHFGIFGLGRVATKELDVGSDLDLLFVCDYSYFKSREAVREVAFRLAEMVISILTSYTREGALFPVDLRLRPSGKEGELVQDAARLLEYFRGEARSWEDAAYLKLRPLAGDLEWARALRQKLAKTSLHSKPIEVIRTDLLDIRSRLEQASDSSHEGFDLKQSAGGIYDIDFALAYGHLKSGKNYRTGAPLVQALQLAKQNLILPQSSADVFLSALRFYRTLDHLVRMATGKPARRIDQKHLEMVSALQVGRAISLCETSGPSRTVDQLVGQCRNLACAVRREMNEVFGI
jgi:[glutamine synthetase] adenylyltransferase / [glutamine synthetase]-adenylyl-L-tyrosine phosphorylase